MKTIFNKPGVHAFFEDMTDVGAFTWARWAFVFSLLSYGLSSVIPYSYVIFGTLSVLLLVATSVTLWWEHNGRENHDSSEGDQ